ncbi:MAG: hypothetical protein JJU29_13140 [Verrucomicrobia bacterium]|nr:hypothetical protein [Verrucomicrobiota bacterium]
MKKINENNYVKSDRELLEEVLDKLIKIEAEISSIKWDVNSLKNSSPPGCSNDIDSQGGYNSSCSGY